MVVKSFIVQAPGANFIKLFELKLHTLLCKLYHFILARNILTCSETAQLTKRERKKVLRIGCEFLRFILCQLGMTINLIWCQDTQHNNTQHKDTQHNDTQHLGTLQYIMLSVQVLCCYSEDLVLLCCVSGATTLSIMTFSKTTIIIKTQHKST
jgi:hypothetical protein